MDMSIPFPIGFQAKMAMYPSRMAFKELRPLSDQILECLKFLRRIDRVVISDIVNGEYIINVYFQHGKDGKTPGAMTPSCTTKHSFDALKNLHKSCVSWSGWHVELDKRYEVPPCSYCGAFNDSHAID